MPKDFPLELLSMVPTVNARPDRLRRWIIAVVALRDMAPTEVGIELFLNYGRNPEKIGWQVGFEFELLGFCLLSLSV